MTWAKGKSDLRGVELAPPPVGGYAVTPGRRRGNEALTLFATAALGPPGRLIANLGMAPPAVGGYARHPRRRRGDEALTLLRDGGPGTPGRLGANLEMAPPAVGGYGRYPRSRRGDEALTLLRDGGPGMPGRPSRILRWRLLPSAATGGRKTPGGIPTGRSSSR